MSGGVHLCKVDCSPWAISKNDVVGLWSSLEEESEEADSRLESASALRRLAVLRALHVCEFPA